MIGDGESLACRPASDNALECIWTRPVPYHVTQYLRGVRQASEVVVVGDALLCAVVGGRSVRCLLAGKGRGETFRGRRRRLLPILFEDGFCVAERREGLRCRWFSQSQHTFHVQASHLREIVSFDGGVCICRGGGYGSTCIVRSEEAPRPRISAAGEEEKLSVEKLRIVRVYGAFPGSDRDICDDIREDSDQASALQPAGTSPSGE